MPLVDLPNELLPIIEDLPVPNLNAFIQTCSRLQPLGKPTLSSPGRQNAVLKWAVKNNHKDTFESTLSLDSDVSTQGDDGNTAA
jgi:hypothetical protein